MKKTVIVKAALALSATAMIASGVIANNSQATGICSETELAGISLSLEQYTENSQSMNESAMQTRALPEADEEEKATETENTAEDATEASAETSGEETTEEEQPVAEPVSKYANMGISIANDYVNIRKKPDTDSKILGKLYRGSAATIVATKGDWVKIKSGSVTGYINSEFLAIGFEAEELEDKYGTKWATVTTTTLKVREKKSTDCTVLGLIPMEETYEVLKEADEWVKILVDEGGDGDESTRGWVSKDYVDITVEFKQAISIEEEEAELRRQEEARKAEEERLKALEEQRRQNQNQSSSNSGSSSSSNSSNSNSGSKGNSSSSSSSSSSNSGSSSSAPDKKVYSGDGADIASYAQKFVGNPYVYGGTSLTRGADCSGFVQTIYSNYDVSLPRTSRSQSTAGKKVSFDELKAGDLVFYAKNGTVNHVAIYIGNGKVCHASNAKDGIKISSWNYRTPHNARRVVE